MDFHLQFERRIRGETQYCLIQLVNSLSNLNIVLVAAKGERELIMIERIILTLLLIAVFEFTENKLIHLIIKVSYSSDKNVFLVREKRPHSWLLIKLPKQS